jgi:hypothetical protein
VVDRPRLQGGTWPHGRAAHRWTAVVLTLAATGCASVAGLLGIAEPRFAVANGRSSTLRLGGPSIAHPRGSATVQVWAHVTNPNQFGLTLTTLDGTLAFEGEDLVDVELPLGLPLVAAADTVIPLDLTFGFESFSSLGNVALTLFTRDELSYELKGTLGVDAGPLGEPTFGPRTWLSGEVDVQNPLSR